MPEGALLLAFITLQRLGELALARRNTRALLARGAIEYGAAHYPLMVALHAAWLIGLWLLAYDRPVDWPWLVVFGILQVARAWVMLSLGSRWTTRIIVTPGETLVARGPYRLMHHPNYLVVIAEIALVPVALGLPLFALSFSVLNAALLWHRICVENAALGLAVAPNAARPPG